jgi:hypothetical protein
MNKISHLRRNITVDIAMDRYFQSQPQRWQKSISGCNASEINNYWSMFFLSAFEDFDISDKILKIIRVGSAG